MKKIYKMMWMSMFLIPTFMFADNNNTGLGEGIAMVAQTGTLFGTIIVVITVSLWLLPIAFAGLVYTGQKKKAEQMHEDVGLKAAIMALLASVLGAAMAFYIVGTIGQYAGADDDSLKGGNAYLLSAVIGKGVVAIKKQ